MVDGLIDDGVDIFAGIIGTPNNLAVRDTLNEECIPQLLDLTGSPAWGRVANYPWTTGALVPYDIEASIYATKLNELKPGATVALYYINNEFGKAYIDEFKKQATEFGFEIVDEQTVEPDDNDPPVTQVGSIAGKTPDAIVAIPLGSAVPGVPQRAGQRQGADRRLGRRWCSSPTPAPRSCSSASPVPPPRVCTRRTTCSIRTTRRTPPSPASRRSSMQYAAAGLTGDPGVTEAGWSVGEATVNILNAALKTGTLSRKSIIEAARNLTFTPSLGRPGVQYKMNGETDPFAFQTLQVLQWSVGIADLHRDRRSDHPIRELIA